MSIRDTIIPLSGIFQASRMVYDIANTGNTDQEAFKTSLNSILLTDAETTEAVYGGPEGILYGLDLLVNLFNPKDKTRDMEIARYVLGIIHLEKKLRKNKSLDEKLVAGIERAKLQVESFGSVTHENVIASLAETYAQTISTIQPQILVSGEPELLTDKHNANKIRALLLASMRSTVLWLQKGGSRWQIILQRNKIISTAKLVRSYIS